ncbi:MAG TPA: hypothetical protein DEA96_09410 [Leptospiraceae bacterium]|nr:hypothetical protein [Spirochaetaceae bacterium]HBS05171.1 hypothetical protein [Leptospiraceae bacterium]|tara:strand:- start:35702 stop:36580 length:879 start_codon:yes stop_codon:yes gene_type:complete
MKAFRLITFLPAFLLFACDFQATIDLSFSHIMKVLQSRGSDGIPARAVIRMEMAGKEACEEKKGKMTEILSRYYGKPESSRCLEEGIGTYLEATVSLVVNRKGLVRDSSITSILLEQDKAGIQIRVAMDQGSFRRMQDEMSEAFFQKPEIEDLLVVLNFRNDTRSSLISQARFVYVDGKPLPMESKVVLDPGRVIEVRLSDVARDYIYQNGSLTLLTVEKTVDGKPFSEIEFAQPEKKPENKTEGQATTEGNPEDSTVDPRLKNKNFPALEQKVQEILKKDATGNESKVGGD